ncbi:oxaloacetate decarboxylase [Lyngbya sp. CCY1209]|uniref:isocitrate lyase/PEP mutase family protein n=1 Tax=Lyngbya sp. CCY1209 TaxID=2886103 RepID=UPI002D1FE86A|nr:oxaloacetate decarboxylase [Lyngbya sp. CCY1209]MEB3886320.1 oxaloacetate decarboxylase [Lyngbya sp. CCY1209]
MSNSKSFRHYLERPGILILPGVYDCLSAKLAEQVGFEAVFTSGFGISGSTLGLPDYGFLTATEMLYSAGRIAQSIDIPLVADMDTGYGNALNVIRTVEDAIQQGISGIILEDQDWPKKCGHFQGKRVIPVDEYLSKLRAAVDAKGDSDLVIVGRTDARASLGLEEAIARGRAYFEAGADVIFVEAPQSAEELKMIAESLSGIPLFANMIEGGKTPILSGEELAELGFKIVVYPLSGLFAATKAMRDCLQQLRSRGTTAGFDNLLSFSEFEAVIDVPKYRELEGRFLESG